VFLYKVFSSDTVRITSDHNRSISNESDNVPPEFCIVFEQLSFDDFLIRPEHLLEIGDFEIAPVNTDTLLYICDRLDSGTFQAGLQPDGFSFYEFH